MKLNFCAQHFIKNSYIEINEKLTKDLVAINRSNKEGWMQSAWQHMEFLWSPLPDLTTLYLSYVIHYWQLFISVWGPLCIHDVKSKYMPWPWKFVSHSLLSRCNRALDLFLSVICIVSSSILLVLARAVLWVSTQSFFPPVSYYCHCLCFLKLDWRNTLFLGGGKLRLNFEIKMIFF